MADAGIGVFVIDSKAVGKKIGNIAIKKKTSDVDGGGNGLSWQALALLVASLLFLFFGASFWYPRNVLPIPRHHLEGDHQVHRHSPAVEDKQNALGTGRCIKCNPVTCSGFGSLEELKKALLKINCGGKPFPLTVINSSIGPTLSTNWLPDGVSLTETLTMEDVDLVDIAEDAFAGPQLSDVTNVVLRNLLKVTVLHRDIFRPLDKLEGILLENLNGLVDVDNGIVSNLPSSKFNSLEFTSETTSISEFIPKFTGPGNRMPHLVTLVYAGNIGTLRYDHLAGLNLNAVTRLVLRSAGITAVESGALSREAAGVQQLYLQGNRLTTLSADAVDIGSFPDASVFLEENPWDCTCELVTWLWSVAEHIEDDPKCATPAHLKDQSIKNLTYSYDDVCPGTATPPPTTEPTTDEPPITAPPAIREPCKESRPEEVPEGIRGDRHHILTETDDGKVLVRVPESFSPKRMEWSGNDGTCYRVDVGDRSHFLVSDGLRPGASYTFCFPEGATVVIGRCFPITLLPSDGDRAWLTNGDKLFVIACVVVASLLALLCPGCLIVLALRRWPGLLGDHIVVVKWHREVDVVNSTNNTTVLAMPRDYEVADDDAATYITPQRPTVCQYASYYVRRLGHVFRRGGGRRGHLPSMGRHQQTSRKTSVASTVTSDEGDFGAGGRRWPVAPEPTPAWVRRPEFNPWSSRPTLQVVRPRGVSTTSGI